MDYNINIAPRTAEALEICANHYFNQGQQKYEAEVAAAKAQAEAAYAKLPDTPDKPTLADFIAQAVSMVHPAKTHEEWKQHFLAAGYGPQTEAEIWEEPELSPGQILAQKRAAIDAETSAAIVAGFDYEIGGEVYRIHYDRDDQLNFESGASGCLMKKAGVEGLPDSAPINAYRPDGSMVRFDLSVDDFLALYGATLAHKAACLQAGSQKKLALEG